MTSRAQTPRFRTAARALVAGAALSVAAVAGWQVVTEEATPRPDQNQPVPTVQTGGEPSAPNLDNGFEWIVAEPSADISYLADVHASSRLQYDECQQDYADVATDPSSNAHPLYFC